MVNSTLMCSVSTIPQRESQAPGGEDPDAHGPGVGGQPRPAAGLSVMGRAIGTADAQPQGTNVR